MPSNPNITSQYYPTLLEIMNLVRAIVNDSFSGATATPGEGQIFTDNSTITPAALPLLNSAIRKVYRKVRTTGQPALIQDNYLSIGLTPVNGPLGPSVPDPTIQVRLGFDGYDNGSGTVNPSFTLPSDLFAPIKLWERLSESEETFNIMNQKIAGLEPRNQRRSFTDWEWRNNNIYMNGSIETRDLRIRYRCFLPQFFNPNMDFSSVQIAIPDCDDAVALYTVIPLARSLGAPLQTIMELENSAKEEIFDLRNEWTRFLQQAKIKRQQFGNAEEDAWFYPMSF